MNRSEKESAWGAYLGQVLQNLGKATIELREGKYEAVIHRLTPYLTRMDIPEDFHRQLVDIYHRAVEALLAKGRE